MAVTNASKAGDALRVTFLPLNYGSSFDSKAEARGAL